MSIISVEKDWPLKVSWYRVFIRKPVAFEPYDEIILELLAVHEGVLSKDELGMLLGFGMKDDPAANLFKDVAEIQLFDYFLQQLKQYDLISVSKDDDTQQELVEINYWGQHALEDHRKYTFYEAIAPVFDHLYLSYEEENDSFFPFYKLPIDQSIRQIKKCRSYILEQDVSDQSQFLKNKILRNQAEKSEYLLDFVEPEAVDKFAESFAIDINLKITEGRNVISVGVEDQPLETLNELLSRPDNKAIYDDLLSYAEYRALIAGDTSIRSADLERYRQHVEWQKVLGIERVEWDSDLFRLLTHEGISSGSIWDAVARNCPLDILEDNLEGFLEYHNWLALTERFDANYIFSYYQNYPWDTDLFIEKSSGPQLEQLLSRGLLEEAFTDWNRLIPKLSDLFIADHLTDGKIHLPVLVKKKPGLSKELIIRHPDLDWGWRYVSDSFDLPYLLENFDKLGSKLDLAIILPRVLNAQDEVFSEFINHPAFIPTVEAFANSPERRFYVNEEMVVLLDKARLDFLELYQLAYWGEGQLSGVESNACLIWTEEVFTTFSHKVKSEKGYRHVSQTIPSLKIVTNFPDFFWDFSILSSREGFIADRAFIMQYKEKLTFDRLVYSIPKSLLLDEFPLFYAWSLEEAKTEKLNECIQFRFSFREILHLIDWHRSETFHLISTEDEAPSFNWPQVINNASVSEVEATFAVNQGMVADLPGQNELVKAVTRKVEWDFIRDNIDLKWDWELVTREKLTVKLLRSTPFLDQYCQYLYWPYILDKIFTIEELSLESKLPEIAAYLLTVPPEIARLSWSTMTKKIPAGRLWNAIEATLDNALFDWDWEYISSSDKIASRLSVNDLEDYQDLLDWHRLSANPVLVTLWKNDKAQFLNYQSWINERIRYLNIFEENWDFKELSKISTITWAPDIINPFRSKWDWEVLSTESGLLTDKNDEGQYFYIPERLEEYAELISWKALSKRIYVWISSDLLINFIDQAWDFEALSGHPKLILSIELLSQTQDKNWNWHQLTRNPMLPLDKNLLLARDFNEEGQKIKMDDWTWVAQKDWDWGLLSSKGWVDRETVITLDDKPWNWKVISERKDFFFDKNMIEVLLLKTEVNWQAIIQNDHTHLTPETIELLEEGGHLSYNDWSVISAHKNLNFHRLNDQNELFFDWQFLNRYKNKWDWEKLVEKEKIDVNNRSILRNFREELNWDQISGAAGFQPDFNILNEFADVFNWNLLSEKLPLTNELLEHFAEYLNWGVVSQNKNIEFSRALIDQFSVHWEWHLLLKNISILEDEDLYDYVLNHISNNPLLELIVNLHEQGRSKAGFIFHYTHVANAIQVLKDQALKSRYRARQLNNSAGTVWQSNTKPRPYARFYFRPRTPNQFYNENLGLIHRPRDYHYQRWEGMDYPKCIFPVFFRVNLYGLLSFSDLDIKISNGNMQRRHTRFSSIEEMISVFNFSDVFHDRPFQYNEKERVMNAREQELLIRDELNLRTLPIKYLSILVPSKQVKAILEQSSIPDKFKKVIQVDSTPFNYENEQIELLENKEEETEILHVAVPDECFFSLRVYMPKHQAQVHEPKGKPRRAPVEFGNYLQFEFSSKVSIPKNATFTVTLYDDQPDWDNQNKQDWLLFTTDSHWEEILTTFGKTYSSAL